MVDDPKPSPETSPEGESKQGGLSSIQKLKYARDQARQENTQLRGELGSMKGELSEVKEMLNEVVKQQGPADPANPRSEDLVAYATNDEYWQSSPSTAASALLRLMDQKNADLAEKIEKKVVGSVQNQTQKSDLTRDVQGRIRSEFGQVNPDSDLGGLARMKLDEKLNRYAKDQDAKKFLQENPEYLYWSVKEAAEELNYSKAPAANTNPIKPEDRLEGSGEGSVDAAEEESSRYEEAKKSGNSKEAFGIMARRLLKNARR